MVCGARGVQRKWVQPDNVISHKRCLAPANPSQSDKLWPNPSKVRLCTNPAKPVKIQPNPAKSVKIQPNLAKSVKSRQSPAVPTELYPPKSHWNGSRGDARVARPKGPKPFFLSKKTNFTRTCLRMCIFDHPELPKVNVREQSILLIMFFQREWRASQNCFIEFNSTNKRHVRVSLWWGMNCKTFLGVYELTF